MCKSCLRLQLHGDSAEYTTSTTTSHAVVCVSYMLNALVQAAARRAVPIVSFECGERGNVFASLCVQSCWCLAYWTDDYLMHNVYGRSEIPID